MFEQLRVLGFVCDHFDYTPYTSIFFSGICIVYLQGLGQKILPGNYVVKKHPKTGVHKKIFLEHALGYFWAFKVGMCLLLTYIHTFYFYFCTHRTCISSSAVDHHICRSYHLLTENQYYQMKQSYLLPRLRSFLH